MNTTLTTITVPELTDSKYGDNLQEQFDNINSNFSLLSNYGINKGKDASEVKSISINLNTYSRKKEQLKAKGKEYFNGKNESETLNLLLELILCEFCHHTIQYYKTNFYKNYIFDNIEYKNPNITFLYKDINTEDLVNLQDSFLELINIDYKDLISYDVSSLNNILKKCLLGSFPYIYLDENIYNDSFLNQRDQPVTNKDDKSCILLLSNSISLGELTDNNLNNIACVVKFNSEKQYSFPQIYYNTTYDEFCWIFGGQKTDFPIKGPRGENGQSGQIYMALIDSIPADASQDSVVTYITQTGNWTPIDNIDQQDITSMNNAMCLVRYNDVQGSDESTNEINIDNSCYWLGFLKVYDIEEDGKEKRILKVLTSDQNKISVTEFKIGNFIELTHSDNGDNNHRIFKDNNNLMIQAGGKNSNTLQINLDTTITSLTTPSLTATNAAVNGKLTAKSGLDVTGKLTANNDLEVKGNLTTTSLTTTSLNATNDNVTGKLTANNATVNGKLTAKSGLDVTGKLTANNDLEVKGKLTANNDLDVTGKLTAKGGLDVTGKLTANNDLEVKGKLITSPAYISEDVSITVKNEGRGSITATIGLNITGYKIGEFLCHGSIRIKYMNFSGSDKNPYGSANKYYTTTNASLNKFPKPITDQYINLFTYHNSESDSSDNDNRIFSNVMCLHITTDGKCSLYGLLDASSAATSTSGTPPGTLINGEQFASSFTYIYK